MTWPLNWANVSLLLLSQRGTECRVVRSMLFQKEQKKCIKEPVFFSLGGCDH